jgi:hypothetical protein
MAETAPHIPITLLVIAITSIGMEITSPLLAETPLAFAVFLLVCSISPLHVSETSPGAEIPSLHTEDWPLTSAQGPLNVGLRPPCLSEGPPQVAPLLSQPA